MIHQRGQMRATIVETIAEAGCAHALDVLGQLALADRDQLLQSLVVLVLAAAEQDRERFARIGLRAGRILRAGENLPLRLVEVALYFFTPLWRRLAHVAHVHHAERDVTRL